jgi:hypothetical protein
MDMKLLSCAGHEPFYGTSSGTMTGWGMVCGISSMLDAFGNGDEGIIDVPAFKEFGKCVGEMGR